MLALAVLAIAAAVVPWDAQYVLVRAVKHNPAVAALEAGIPDIGAVIFAALGVALALHGKRASPAPRAGRAAARPGDNPGQVGVQDRHPHRRRDRPRARHRPAGPARLRPHAPERPEGGVMIYAILIAAGGIFLTTIKWAFFPFIPWRRLPRHRVRYLRARLYLRLHPG